MSPCPTPHPARHGRRQTSSNRPQVGDADDGLIIAGDGVE
jgi:hypothetical protein